MNLTTKVIQQFVRPRLRAIQRFASEPEVLQLQALSLLLERAQATEYGKLHRLHHSMSYEQFAGVTPVVDYEQIKGYIARMIEGERNVLVPGVCRWYAKSSGTSGDKSKFIPVPNKHLNDCHFKGGGDALWIYLRNYPDSQFFSTRALVLGGSHAPVSLGGKSSAGDLSAILVQHMPKLGAWRRTPSRSTLLMREWSAKMKAIVKEVTPQNIGSLSGVPSWIMVMLKEVLAYSGASSIKELWPSLEIFFHGGISFAPYREAYKTLMGTDIRYEETYNASEGFFAIQDDPEQKGLLLMLDYGVFYEFLPLDALSEADGELCPRTAPIPLWEIEIGKSYAILITTLGGLYRYMLGDTIEFVSTDPYRLVITGRTKHYINAFGEELMVANTDQALAIACTKTGARVVDYTAAPHFFLDEGKGRHDWAIEFEIPPSDLDAFATLLDEEVKKTNSDYEAKRYCDMTLRRLEITAVSPGTFQSWLARHGKLGGQHKVPRLFNSRKYIDDLLLESHTHLSN